MRFTITWIFPFVAGLMTYHFIFMHDQEVMQSTEYKTRAPASIPHRQEQLPQKFVLRSTGKITTLNNATANESQKQTVSINLTESAIVQMEDNWNDLPQQAEAKREIRGWRMTKITADSSFYKVGLREGDLITEEFLDRLRNSDARLVTRMEQILNRITR